MPEESTDAPTNYSRDVHKLYETSIHLRDQLKNYSLENSSKISTKGWEYAQNLISTMNKLCRYFEIIGIHNASNDASFHRIMDSFDIMLKHDTISLWFTIRDLAEYADKAFNIPSGDGQVKKFCKTCGYSIMMARYSLALDGKVPGFADRVNEHMSRKHTV